MEQANDLIKYCQMAYGRSFDIVFERQNDLFLATLRMPNGNKFTASSSNKKEARKKVIHNTIKNIKL